MNENWYVDSLWNKDWGKLKNGLLYYFPFVNAYYVDDRLQTIHHADLPDLNSSTNDECMRVCALARAHILRMCI